MKEQIANNLKHIGNKFHGLASMVYTPPVPEPTVGELRVKPWNEIDGEHTLRLNYDLNEKSVVFDMGGYEGQWAADIFTRYACTIHVFEPVKSFADAIKERFKNNAKVTVYPFGLGARNETLELSLEANESSAFKHNGPTTKIKLVPAYNFMQEHKITKIDLIKINIEGGEYDLLDDLIEHDFVKNITDIQVQFHDFAPDAEARMKRIQGALGKTHKLTYQYPFIWENWHLKGTK